MNSKPACFAALVALLSTTSFAFELKRDSSGEPVRWQRAVEFIADTELGAALKEPSTFAAVETSFASFRTVSGAPLSVREGATTGVGYDFANPASNQSEIVALNEWEYDSNAIAVTIVTVDAKKHAIVDADIAFNIQHRRFQVLPAAAQTSGPSGQFDDVQNTLTHELGHAVGLGHEPDEPKAVMYPSARRGETTKRVLSQDDVSGLAQLYGTVSAPTVSTDVTEEEQAAGCSATGGAGFMPVVFAALSVLFRRRKLAVAAAAALSTAAVASERTEANVADASQAVRAEVVSRKTLAPVRGERLLRTEVRLKTTECIKGSCDDEYVVVLPGGRYGDFEQTVEGLTVPEIGEKVALTVAPARVKLYRLQHAPDMVAFFQGLVRAQQRTESGVTQR